jgi:hypothetical protein
MKGTIKQYRPAYFSGYENELSSFNSLKELLNIKWVKQFSKSKNFYRYSIDLADSYSSSRHTLMAEYKNGTEWWVIGFIDKNTEIKGIELFNPEEE